jgi:hypothetical protein
MQISDIDSPENIIRAYKRYVVEVGMTADPTLFEAAERGDEAVVIVMLADLYRAGIDCLFPEFYEEFGGELDDTL